MLYIVKAHDLEEDADYDYEYGNLPHAEEHYNCEKTAEIWQYEYGKETLIRKKINGIER